MSEMARKERMTVTVDAELIEAGNRAVKAGRGIRSAAGSMTPSSNGRSESGDCAAWPPQSPPTNANTGPSPTTSFWRRSALTRRPRSSSVDVADQARAHAADATRPPELAREARPGQRRAHRVRAEQSVDVASHQGGVARGSGAGHARWGGRPGLARSRLAASAPGGGTRGHGLYRPLDESLGRAAGALLGATKQSDVIDAALVLLAHDGDRIVTSDPDDYCSAGGGHRTPRRDREYLT